MEPHLRTVRIAGCMVALVLVIGGTERLAAAQEVETEVETEEVEKGAFGLGLVFGEPSGVNAKLYLSDTTAIDATIGSAIVGGGIQIHGDYLWHPWVLEDRELFVLPAYVGGGLRIFQHRRPGDSDFHFGLRAVGGMLFDFKELPIDVFVEVAAVLDTVFADDPEHKGLGVAINLGAGVRYYF